MAAIKPLPRIIGLFLAGSLASCAVSLGKFDDAKDDYKTYYESLGEVKALYDGGEDHFEVQKSLFNEKTVKELKWEKEEYEVKDRQYLYWIIPFKVELKVQTFAFYVYTEQTDAILSMSAFYFLNDEEAPKKIKYLTSPETEPVYDDEGEIIGEKEIEYDDLMEDRVMVSGRMRLNSSAWTSIGFGGFTQRGYDDSYLHTGKDGLLYIRAENNSGCNRNKLTPVSFKLINLFIRAI